MKLTPVYTKRRINANKYVNTETGESFCSEFPNSTSVNMKNNEKSVVNSDKYVILDSDALSYLFSILSSADLSRVVRLSNMVKGSHNFLHDDSGKPHVRKTLRTSLNYDESEFCRFMKRLQEKSLIHYYPVFKKGRNYKWIMLNPTLARKGKTFHKDCINVFDDLSKKKNHP